MSNSLITCLDEEPTPFYTKEGVCLLHAIPYCGRCNVRSGKERRHSKNAAIRIHIHDGIPYRTADGCRCSRCNEIQLFRKRSVVDRREAQLVEPKPAPCPGCGRVLDWPCESGRWRVTHFPIGKEGAIGKPKVQSCYHCRYQHEHQDQWVDCPGAKPTFDPASIPGLVSKEIPVAPSLERIAEIREDSENGLVSPKQVVDLLAALDVAEARRIAAEQGLAIVGADNVRLRTQDIVARSLIQDAYGIMQSRGYASDWIKQADAWLCQPRRKE